MEEEGTVVYYEDSPSGLSLDGSNKEDLLIRQSLPEHCPSDQRHSWRWGTLIKWVWSYLPFIPTYNESIYLNKITCELMTSPLLTNEDLHLLNSALPNHPHPDPSPSSIPSIKWISLFSAPFLSLLWMLHPLMTVVGVATLFFLLGIPQLVMWWAEFVLDRAQKYRLEYYSLFEKLLIQLTATNKWIHEVEVVSRGLTRPLSSLPGMNQCHTHKLLRHSVLCTCADLIGSLRENTRQLCDPIYNIQLEAELEEHANYLAFRTLSDLHPFMKEEVTTIVVTSCSGREDSGSLESLKDACTLLAVQNSEFLRRMCLLSSAGTHATPTHFISHMLTLQKTPLLSAHLSGYLKKFVPLIRACSQKLAWRLSFHSNMLLGVPPRRPVASDVQTHSEIQPLSDEVHYLDLKAQCLLQRIRDFGVLLKSCDSLPTQQLLESHMTAIQSDLRGVADGVGDTSSLVWTRVDINNRESISSNADLATDEVGTDVSDEGVKSESQVSEDEIFEGYVSDSDLKSGRVEEVELAEKDREELKLRRQEVIEIPGRMLTELKSVLTIRNHIKEKKKETKHNQRETDPTLVVSKNAMVIDPTPPDDAMVIDPTPPDDAMTDPTHNGLNPLSIQLASAIKGRRILTKEDIFS